MVIVDGIFQWIEVMDEECGYVQIVIIQQCFGYLFGCIDQCGGVVVCIGFFGNGCLQVFVDLVIFFGGSQQMVCVFVFLWFGVGWMVCVVV